MWPQEENLTSCFPLSDRSSHFLPLWRDIRDSSNTLVSKYFFFRAGMSTHRSMSETWTLNISSRSSESVLWMSVCSFNVSHYLTDSILSMGKVFFMLNSSVVWDTVYREQLRNHRIFRIPLFLLLWNVLREQLRYVCNPLCPPPFLLPSHLISDPMQGHPWWSKPLDIIQVSLFSTYVEVFDINDHFLLVKTSTLPSFSINDVSVF